MLEGQGETTVAVAHRTAFDYLADPRHAPGWFAGVTFAEEPQGTPRVGTTWRFRQRNGKIVPVRIVAHERLVRFAWRTTYPAIRSNLEWQIAFDAAPEGTALRMTIRILPSPLAALGLVVTRRASQLRVEEQARAAVERARDALLERFPPPSPPTTRRASSRRERR